MNNMFVIGNVYRSARVCLWVAAMIVTPTPLLAQLRMGSTHRAIYQRPVETSDSDYESMATAEGQVARASAILLAGDDLDVPELKRPPTRTVKAKPAHNNSLVTPAGCNACGRSSHFVSRAENTVIETSSPMLSAAEAEWETSSEDASDHCDSCNMRGSACDSYSMESCCDPCGSYGVSPLANLLSRMSFRAEAPLFWRKGQSTPALVTADSPTAANATDVPGSLTSAGVQVLRGGVYDNESRAGGRISLWIWLDQSRRSALTFRYWNAGDINGSAVFNSSDFPTQVLGRPVFNTDPGTNAADFVAVGEPNALTGLLQINTRSQVYGMNFEVERMFYADRFTRVHWVYGYNSFSLKESLQINSTTTDIDATSLTFNHVFRVSDTFRTANRLDGFSLGFRSKRRIAAFQLETLVRLTSGNLRRQVFIQGSTSDTDGAGNTTSQTEGVLARATNARDLVSNTFVLSPEAGINLGYALSANLDFSIGYNYLMVPKVAQASRQLNSDLRTNLSNPISGPQDPAFRFHNKNYWVRSLGLGVQYRY